MLKYNIKYTDCSRFAYAITVFVSYTFSFPQCFSLYRTSYEPLAFLVTTRVSNMTSHEEFCLLGYTACSPLRVNRRFGRACHLCLRGWRLSKAEPCLLPASCWVSCLASSSTLKMKTKCLQVWRATQKRPFLLPLSCLFLTWLTLQSWRRRRHVPPNRWSTRTLNYQRSGNLNSCITSYTARPAINSGVWCFKTEERWNDKS
jgi:hypothetical protein